MNPSTEANASLRWEDARRVESWAGEVRVNLFRAAAILAFYTHHLLRHAAIKAPTEVDLRFHHASTAIAFTWMLVVSLLHQTLHRRIFPEWLKYAVVTVDITLAALLLMVAGGPKSPLAILLVLVVGTSALRLSLRVVWATTIGSLLAYLFVVGYVNRTAPDLRIPHSDQVIFMLGLGGIGVLAGQSVRQARRLIRGYPVAVEAES